ncbi:scavenger receptor cysteine-rich type 1 protein M160-like [Perca fluviatilis]|uniref:scavenger receptor cysteine-rich type 1 protein M160-like n=1 Tax=Perca fluviatilis TaxID=8168 RepID=UPI001966A035|nr:scavenger receptor cysteine-rich type 1 protein M160-like [Perca fluviatilis]
MVEASPRQEQDELSRSQKQRPDPDEPSDADQDSDGSTVQKKTQRRLWSDLEKKAVWQQLGNCMTLMTVPDSVRLVNGTSLCSGRLEVKTNQSAERWSSVCEEDFDQQDAEVVCRELGCGAPSVLQGALHGEVEPPMRTKEFQCGGHESALLDCRSSVPDRKTCSPGKAVGLTCSESVRLVGGASRCSGTLEVKQGEWRPVGYSVWTLKTAAAACRESDCGSAVSLEEREESSDRSVWWIRSGCVESGSALRECAASGSSDSFLHLTCSDSVRLVNGTSLCSGRLEVNTNQSTRAGPQCVKRTLTSGMQRWSVGSLAVGLLPVLRGRSMEKWSLQ